MRAFKLLSKDGLLATFFLLASCDDAALLETISPMRLWTRVAPRAVCAGSGRRRIIRFCRPFLKPNI